MGSRLARALRLPGVRVEWTVGGLALASSSDPLRHRPYRPLWTPRVVPGFLPAQNAIAHVANDQKFASTVSGQTTTGAKGGTFTAGNLLVAVVGWSYSGSTGTPTISLPSGWTDSGKGTQQNSVPNGCCAVHFLPNNPGGAQTWTWTVTANGRTMDSWSLTIIEFSGVATSSPLDLTTTSNGGSSTSADGGAQSGTTQSGSLLIGGLGHHRSTLRSWSVDTTNSVPTTGWSLIVGTGSTNGTVNSICDLSYNILSGTQASPHSVLTPNASGTWELFELSFKTGGSPQTVYLGAPNVAVAAKTLVTTSAQIVGLQAPNLALAAKSLAILAGPTTFLLGANTLALAARSLLVLGPGLRLSTRTETGISGGPPGNNTTETVISYLDSSGNGAEWDFIPAYGGDGGVPWREVSSGTPGPAQNSLATSKADSIFHLYGYINGNPNGASSEDPTYTLSELSSAVTRAVRAAFDTGQSSESGGFSWRVRTVLWPLGTGDLIAILAVDMTNSTSQTMQNPHAFDVTHLSGLTQVLQNGVVAWQQSDTGYGSKGGTPTSPIPTGPTTGEPDVFYAIPHSGSGLSHGVAAARLSTVASAFDSASNVQMNLTTNANRLKAYLSADHSASLAAATRRWYELCVIKAGMTGAIAISLAADFITLEAGSIVSVGTPASPFFDLPSSGNFEGCYVIAASANRVELTHTFPTNVAKRWLVQYKLTGYTASTPPLVSLAGSALVSGTDYVSAVDTGAQVAYVRLLKGLVASGAGAGELNSGLLVLADSLGQTVTLGAAAVATTARQVSIALGPLTRTLGAAAVGTVEARSLSKTIGPVTRTLGAAVVSVVARALSISTGIIRSLGAAATPVAAQPLSRIFGSVSRTLGAPGVAVSAQPVSRTTGPLTRQLGAAALPVQARMLVIVTAGAPQTKVLGAPGLSLAADALTISRGSLVRSLSVPGVALNVRVLSVSVGPLTHVLSGVALPIAAHPLAVYSFIRNVVVLVGEPQSGWRVGEFTDEDWAVGALRSGWVLTGPRSDQ